MSTATSPLPIAVLGAAGRMGERLCALIAAAPDLVLSGALVRSATRSTADRERFESWSQIAKPARSGSAPGCPVIAMMPDVAWIA